MKDFDYTKEEALELGKIEGQKAILAELVEMNCTDINYLNAYLKARLETINDSVKLVLKLRRLSNVSE